MKRLTVRIEDTEPKNPFLIREPYFFVELLRRRYDVTILTDGDEEPDIMFYSCWGSQNNVRWTRCLRIYYTAERDCPDFNMCDYAIGLVNVGATERFFHFPFYVFYNDIMRRYETLPPIGDKAPLLDRGFCSAVVTDPYRSPVFFEVFNRLNEYKPVASGGRWNNTVGGPVADKLDFIKGYKFNIAFENMKADGYVTEKILESLVARTVPIYWGSRSVKDEFGEGSYIDISDFDSLDSAVEYIKKVDNDDELYMQILGRGAQMPYTYDEWCDRLLDFLCNAIENGSRIFDSRCNKVYAEKCIYHTIHTSLPGRMYRNYKRTKYIISDLFRKNRKKRQ